MRADKLLLWHRSCRAWLVSVGVDDHALRMSVGECVF